MTKKNERVDPNVLVSGQKLMIVTESTVKSSRADNITHNFFLSFILHVCNVLCVALVKGYETTATNNENIYIYDIYDLKWGKRRQNDRRSRVNERTSKRNRNKMKQARNHKNKIHNPNVVRIEWKERKKADANQRHGELNEEKVRPNWNVALKRMQLYRASVPFFCSLSFSFSHSFCVCARFFFFISFWQLAHSFLSHNFCSVCFAEYQNNILHRLV